MHKCQSVYVPNRDAMDQESPFLTNRGVPTCASRSNTVLSIARQNLPDIVCFLSHIHIAVNYTWLNIAQLNRALHVFTYQFGA